MTRGFEAGTENRIRLNEAIFKVITNQYKKDAKYEHELVEAAGYKITKYDGKFWVKNPTTNKDVAISKMSDSWTPRWGLILGNNDVRYQNERGDWNYHFEMCKVDLVGYLEKPFNRTYWMLVREYNDPISDARQKYELLKSAKWDVEYYGRRIEEAKKKVKNAQDELIYCAKRQAEAEQKLRNKLKDLKLA